MKSLQTERNEEGFILEYILQTMPPWTFRNWFIVLAVEFSQDSRVGRGRNNSSSYVPHFSRCSHRSFWAQDLLFNQVVRQSAYQARTRLKLFAPMNGDRGPCQNKNKQNNNPPQQNPLHWEKDIYLPPFLSNSLMCRNLLNASPQPQNRSHSQS